MAGPTRRVTPASSRFRGTRAALLVTALVLVGMASGVRADTLVVNVNGITLDERGEVRRFAALRFGSDGKVKEAYPALPTGKKDKRATADYQLDGRGRTMLPGFVHSHVDVLELGFATLAGDGGGSDLSARPPPRAIDRDAAFERAQKVLVAAGITAVTDMGTTIEEWQAFRRAGDVGRLKLRIMSYADGNAAMTLIGGPGPTPWLYDDRLRLNGVLLRLDRPLDSGSAWLKAPYSDGSGDRGQASLTQSQLGNLMSRAAMDGFQVAVAAHGDAAVASFLDAVTDLAPTYRGERRWRVEGAEVVDPADLPRLRALGIVVSGRTDFLTPQVEAKLGPARLGGAYAWRGLQGPGAGLALAAGGPASPPLPFAAMARAVAREDAHGQPSGGWQPQERLTRAQALAALTAGAAYAGGAEQRFGRLAPGQRADFVLVDTDPLLADPVQLRRARVLETWIGGERVFAADEHIVPAAGGR